MSKPKININPSKISSDEIVSRQDFNSVITKYRKVSKPFYKKTGNIVATVVTVVTVTVATYYVTYTRKHTKTSVPVVTEKTVNTHSLTSGNQQAASKQSGKPFIQPPLKKVTIPATGYKINGTKGGTITHTSGSIIKIPQAAFVDEKGAAVSGEVEIRYREFHDMVTVFLSGIPMTYDSAGVQYHFETAGMIDINGFQNNKPVHIAPGKKIDIQMITNKSDNRFNLYYLDTLQRNWTYRGKDKLIMSEPYRSSLRSDYNDKFTDSSSSSMTTSTSEIKQLEEKLITSREAVIKFEKEAVPLKPRKANTQRNRFNIEVDAKEFPELAVYKNAVFEVDEKSGAFTSSYYHIIWEDAVLKEGNKKGMYVLQLKKAGDTHILDVYPVFEGRDYENAQKEYEQKFKEYSTTLANRKEQERRAEEEFKLKQAEYQKKKEELEKEWKKQQARIASSRNEYNKIYRAFEIDGFGMYNSDCAHNLPSGGILSLKFSDKQGNELKPYITVMLADKDADCMYTYYENMLDKFRYKPSSSNALWMCTQDGKLAYATREDFKKIPRGTKTHTFVLNIADKELATADEVKELLGWNK